jgi:hypothetical protein
MAEIKNSFLKSKMNKDLDDRLIPNGEYRNANNISVGKSEDSDIGALETILGNSLALGNPTGYPTGLEVIGFYSDQSNSRIFYFATDNTNHYIFQFTQPASWQVLVTGSFLNFNKANPISGVSLIEDLLFFTDYRNQPRKINVKSALTDDYYNNEVQISVAKYNPYEPISLLEKLEVTGATTLNPATTVITLANANASIKPGMLLVTTNNTNNDEILPTEYLYVVSNIGVAVTLNVAPSQTIQDTDKLYFLNPMMTGQEISSFFDGVQMPGATTWPGDPDYLESRFARFSYRYQYDDGEYSIMAPFTPITFIPKQKGYFLSGDENATYKSTIVEFMENGVQNIDLLITLPDNIDNLTNLSTSSYKIKSVDILYKEADSRAVKVVDSVKIGTVADTALNNVFTYSYQSSKPFRTLPEGQTTRVFDKVPVLAYSQETAGNRIIYGNFKDKYTPPNFIPYQTAVAPKFTTSEFNNWAEYPNHSVKQNRNYQVGFILADKFGRQSSVILSNIKDFVTTKNGVTYGGSTVYSPYNPITETSPTIKDWFGDALRVIVNSEITAATNENTPDIPGLYANAKGNGFDVANINLPNVTANIYTFTPVTTTNIPELGDYLRGEYKDFVKVSIPPTVDGSGEYTVTCDGSINEEIYESTGNTGTQVKYAYTLNEKGWYSYKIVVKQQEQEYYNVYLPGILDGYPTHSGTSPYPIGEEGETAHIVLFNDNINKVPRDLLEVGPQQKQFRSSVQLYGRVENAFINSVTTNKQFYPGILTDTAITIATATDLNMDYDEIASKGNFYQLDTNPLIARLSTSQPIGVVTGDMAPFLAIYETEPVESLLDIYWETASVGLISDLNAAILTDFNGPVGFASYNWVQPESVASQATFLSNVQPIDKDGVQVDNTTLTNYTTTNSAIQPVNTTATTGGYSFKITSPFVYTNTSDANDNFTLTMNITDSSGISSGTLQLVGSLSNVIPVISNVTTGELPAINNDDATTGIVADYSGVNGSSDASNNTLQLQWSITGGNTAGYFSINANTGQLTQTSASANTYNLTIRLTDANNGTGAEFAEANQQVIVSSTVIGFPFLVGDRQNNITYACPSNGSRDTSCGNNTYYNRTTSSGTPSVNDIIASGPAQSATLLEGGFYTYNCTNGTGTGNDRLFFQVEYDSPNSGKVIDVTNCGAP